MPRATETHTAPRSSGEGLATRKCVPCCGGVPALTADQIAPLLTQLDGWKAIDNHHLAKSYHFPDFVTALRFVNRIGDIAEEEQHHPDLHLAWGKVGVQIFTHKVDGLTESDFILAAKIDKLRG